MTGEIILGGLALVLFVSALGAVAAYMTGHPSAAMVWNGVVPVLVLAGSALAIVINLPTTVNLVGALYFVVPLGVLIACGVGICRQRMHPAFFWCTWAVNVAIVAFFFYLSFLFRIF